MNENRETIISVVGNGRGMPGCDRCNAETGYDEINANVGKIERGKSLSIY